MCEHCSRCKRTYGRTWSLVREREGRESTRDRETAAMKPHEHRQHWQITRHTSNVFFISFFFFFFFFFFLVLNLHFLDLSFISSSFFLSSVFPPFFFFLFFFHTSFSLLFISCQATKMQRQQKPLPSDQIRCHSESHCCARVAGDCAAMAACLQPVFAPPCRLEGHRATKNEALNSLNSRTWLHQWFFFFFSSTVQMSRSGTRVIFSCAAGSRRVYRLSVKVRVCTHPLNSFLLLLPLSQPRFSPSFRGFMCSVPRLTTGGEGRLATSRPHHRRPARGWGPRVCARARARCACRKCRRACTRAFRHARRPADCGRGGGTFWQLRRPSWRSWARDLALGCSGGRCMHNIAAYVAS